VAASDEWESNVKSIQTNLGMAAAEFDAGLVSLAVLQRQQQLALGNGDVIKGFSERHGGPVTPPSPRSLSADLNRPMQRRKKAGSSRVQGRSASRGADPEVIDRGAESEHSTTSTHPSLGRPYTPSHPDDSTDADFDSLRKASTDSNPCSFSSKDAHGGHQLEPLESSVHWAPWTDSLTADPMVRVLGSENIVKPPPSTDPVGTHS
jgi:hypothetical protein